MTSHFPNGRSYAAVAAAVFISTVYVLPVLASANDLDRAHKEIVAVIAGNLLPPEQSARFKVRTRILLQKLHTEYDENRSARAIARRDCEKAQSTHPVSNCSSERKIIRIVDKNLAEIRHEMDLLTTEYQMLTEPRRPVPTQENTVGRR